MRSTRPRAHAPRRSAAVVAAEPVAPGATLLAEDAPEPSARLPAAGQRLQSGPAELADVALDHEEAAEHDEEPDAAADQRVLGEGQDEQDQAGEHAERGPPDHAGGVAVERRARDLLDEVGIGRVELRLDLLEDLLLFVGERHHVLVDRPRRARTDRRPEGGLVRVAASGTPPAARRPGLIVAHAGWANNASGLRGRFRPITGPDRTAPGRRRRRPTGTPRRRAGARRARRRRGAGPPRPGPRRRPAGPGPPRARRGTTSPARRSARSAR